MAVMITNENVEQEINQSRLPVLLDVYATWCGPCQQMAPVFDELEKELVLDLDDVKYELSPGFRSLENVEGMAFGPTLPNGKKSLVIVSDNNFRSSQRNSVIVFEVDMEALKRIGK